MPSNEELARIGGWIGRLGEDISELATEGYDQAGPGAVFLSEQWLLGIPAGTPCYLPRSHPLFAETAPEIQSAVDVYDPESECVMVVSSATDRIYLLLIYLSGADGERLRKPFH